jgi:glycosyltransferase involved in cell wall biosynthesis
VEQRVAILRDKGRALSYGVPETVLDSGRPRRGPFDTRPIRHLRRVVEAWEPDVVQLHGGETLKYAIAARIFGTAIVVYRRIGCAPPNLRRQTRRLAYGALMRRTDKTVVVARALYAEAIEFFNVPHGKLVMIPNGVDAHRMEPSVGREETRRELGLTVDATVILSLGALTWEKDPLAQLDLSTSARGEGENTFHVFAGDGPMRPDLEKVASERGWDDRVLILGSRDDVADVLAASDVLLFASRPDGMEGMPASLIEAGMCGIPVVGFDVAGASEVVVDGETGFLAPWADTVGLERRLIQLLGDPALRASMGEAARDRCRSKFDIEEIAPRYLELYEGLLANKGQRASEAMRTEGKVAHLSRNRNRNGASDSRIYFGCGLHPVQGWENVDKSYGPILTRHPRLKVMLRGLGLLSQRQFDLDWPSTIRRVDVRRSFPWPASSVEAIYCDRMLGFLSRDEGTDFLRNCYRVLCPGGKLRLVAFDLETMVRKYSEEKTAGRDDAADSFMHRITSDVDSGGPRLNRFAMRLVRGFDHHSNRTLYDLDSLRKVLVGIGFSRIMHQEIREGDFPDVHRLEEHLGDDAFGSDVLVIQASKPPLPGA